MLLFEKVNLKFQSNEITKVNFPSCMDNQAEARNPTSII